MSTWRTDVIVFRENATPWPRTMSDEELNANLAILRRVPASVDAWSEGNARMEPYEIRMASGPLRSLTDLGDGVWWVAPEDVRDELRPGFDSVIVLWPSDGTQPLCGWGCTIGANDTCYGAGFSSCVSDHWRHDTDRLHPDEGFVHEWLHQAESHFRNAGFDRSVFPDLHDAGHSRSARGLVPGTYAEHEIHTGTWQPWYRDYMTGNVAKGRRRSYGLGREIWATRP